MEKQEVIERDFEKRYIIGGSFVFGLTTEVYQITFEKMVYSIEEHNSVIDEMEDKGLDYIVLPTYSAYLLPKNIGVQKKIERLRTMCKNIGWECIF